jgi:hypothetical protein
VYKLMQQLLSCTLHRLSLQLRVWITDCACYAHTLLQLWHLCAAMYQPSCHAHLTVCWCPSAAQASVTHYTLDRPAIAALLQAASGVAEAGALLAEPAMAADMWVLWSSKWSVSACSIC